MGSPATFNGTAIGTEDCWVETSWAPGKVIYTVHAEYVSRAGGSPDITGACRAAIEGIGATLGAAFKPTPLVEYGERGGIPLFIGGYGGVKATLVNPYTSMSVTDCYCTNIEITDSGHRFALITATFEKPLAAADGAAPDTVDFTWAGVNLGNQPGTMQVEVDNSFVRYTIRTAYNGSGAPVYPATLADSLSLAALFTYEVPRGAVGARGLIKTYSQASGSLTWVSKSTTITAVYPESIATEPYANGSVGITVTFVKAR